MPSENSKPNPNPNESAKQTPNLPPVPTKNPVDLPNVADARDGGQPNVKTVGAPSIPSGDVTIVPPPIVLANVREMDPANPAGATRYPSNYPRSQARKEAHVELEKMLKEDRTQPGFNHDRLHELHYLANGLDGGG